MSKELEYIDVQAWNGRNWDTAGQSQNGRRQDGTESNRRKAAQRKKRKKTMRRRILCAGAGLGLLCILGVAGTRRLLILGFGGDGTPENGWIQTDWGSDGNIPDSLLELMEKNPETTQFVMDYPKKKDLHEEIDISGEVAKGEIPLFLQWDERWGYELYGSDCMAVTGCGPTCLSMVYCGLSGDSEWNPYQVARMAEEEGFYVQGSGSSWDLMTSGAEKLGLTVEELVFDEEHIRSALKNGSPVICIMGPGDFTTTGHFIVLKGMDSKGNILICDPNSRENSGKEWKLEDLMPQIRNLWEYSY